MAPGGQGQAPRKRSVSVWGQVDGVCVSRPGVGLLERSSLWLSSAGERLPPGHWDVLANT